jgi:hypothetical protein
MSVRGRVEKLVNHWDRGGLIRDVVAAEVLQDKSLLLQLGEWGVDIYAVLAVMGKFFLTPLVFYQC